MKRIQKAAGRFWRNQRGITLLELIVVLGLLGILVTAVGVAPAMYNYESTKAANLQIVQESIEDAMVGYYSITGHFPSVLDASGNPRDLTTPYELTLADMEALFTDVSRNSGYIMFPKEELPKYKFTAYQPNDYLLKVTVEWR